MAILLICLLCSFLQIKMLKFTLLQICLLSDLFLQNTALKKAHHPHWQNEPLVCWSVKNECYKHKLMNFIYIFFQ